jgi:flagellar biosynthesis anti-sigma factor FlgM
MRVVSDPQSAAASGAARQLSGVAKQQSPVASPEEAAASGNATVSISSAARAKAAEPDMDHAKVARLKQAIDGNNYHVDSQQVAARLLEEE